MDAELTPSEKRLILRELFQKMDQFTENMEAHPSRNSLQNSFNALKESPHVTKLM